MSATTWGSRRPSVKWRASTSADVAASDATSATSPACAARLPTASRLGPRMGRDRAGETNQLVSVLSAEVSDRAASVELLGRHLVVDVTGGRDALVDATDPGRQVLLHRQHTERGPDEHQPDHAATDGGDAAGTVPHTAAGVLVARDHGGGDGDERDDGGQAVEADGPGPQQGDAAEARHERPAGAAAGVAEHRHEGDDDGHGGADEGQPIAGQQPRPRPPAGARSTAGPSPRATRAPPRALRSRTCRWCRARWAGRWSAPRPRPPCRRRSRHRRPCRERRVAKISGRRRAIDMEPGNLGHGLVA